MLFFLLPLVFAAVTEIQLVQVVVQPTAFEAAKTTTTFTTTTTTSTVASLVSDIYAYKGPYTLNKTFAVAILDETNRKRKLHGAQLLAWNNTLFSYAQRYAAKYDCSGILAHLGGAYGENIALGYTVTGSVDAWYEEGEGFPYGTESIYNHFTALVWNSTSQMGCATKYCNAIWNNYIVCSYYPAGNVVGEEGMNVFPPA